MKKNTVVFLFFIWPFLLLYSCMGNTEEPQKKDKPSMTAIKKGWRQLAGNRQGKVIYARPPKMFILNLPEAVEMEIPFIQVEGAKGRRMRGKTPRPSWAPDGKRFIYRFNGKVYISDLEGHHTIIFNHQMDCSDETRWSWFRKDHQDWIVGPSKNGNVILINSRKPEVINIAYHGTDVKKHCEVTANGKYVVYDNDSDIWVTPFGSHQPGIKISQGQSCRPCAAADNRIAWLPSPHVYYNIHDAVSGKFLGKLNAPEGEELYRLNWSNQPDFAIHMFGSNGNERMHIRKITSGESLYIGDGWDPDLWIADQ